MLEAIFQYLTMMPYGIVGCRLATNYGKNVARKIAKELANRNINVISGLAIGIDKYAHLGEIFFDETPEKMALRNLRQGIRDEASELLGEVLSYRRVHKGEGSSLYYCLGKGYRENPIPEDVVKAGGMDLAEAIPDLIMLAMSDYTPQI